MKHTAILRLATNQSARSVHILLQDLLGAYGFEIEMVDGPKRTVCPVCESRCEPHYLTPDNEEEMQCPHCGSVSVLREGTRWETVGNLYPWRSPLLTT